MHNTSLFFSYLLQTFCCKKQDIDIDNKIFRKMADEKTARGKPLPKEEVDFVLIGAGGIVVIVSWWRVGVNSFSTNSEVLS